MTHPVNRRQAISSAVAASTATALALSAANTASAADQKPAAGAVNAKTGKLKQSFCRWCYSKQSLEELCAKAASLGLYGIDLLDPKDFPLLKQHGLVCTMVQSHSLDKGLCDPKYHAESLDKMAVAIEATSKEGWRNVICFSGNARGIDRETGLKNCTEALKKIVGEAEKKNVVLCMELLNSRVDHADYMCDNSAWGIELCKRVGSNNFKLLYDIYHMQIMEGDIIRSINKNHQYFGHYHTGGNPGRNEIDTTQELYYPAIARAIAETGFDGYFAHEFIPKQDPLTSLTKAVELCMV